jgi:hypothetical protein
MLKMFLVGAVLFLSNFLIVVCFCAIADARAVKKVSGNGLINSARFVNFAACELWEFAS